MTEIDKDSFNTFHAKKRRRSPIFAKCEDLMEELWNCGYRKEIPFETLRYYVQLVCGGFRTTVFDYLGKRAKFYTSRGREGILKEPAKFGYLERFGFVSLKSPRIMNLHHENVSRSYHYLQSNVVNFSLSQSNIETSENIRSNDDSTLLLHTKRERETKELTPEELAVLTATPCEEPNRGKIRWRGES